MIEFRMIDSASNEVRRMAELYVKVFAGPPWFETWDIEGVVTDFCNEIQKPQARCLTLIENETLIGFTWGYEVVVELELGTHLEAPGLHLRRTGRYFYVDECGIDPDHQGRGFGTLLVRKLFRQQPCKKVLLRTKENSPMHHIIERMGGTVVQSISKHRVIMELFL